MKKSLIIIHLIFVTVFANAQVLDSRMNNTNLLSMATISVTIGGDFPVTGSFPAFISERVDQFVTRIFWLTATALPRVISTSSLFFIVKELILKVEVFAFS